MIHLPAGFDFVALFHDYAVFSLPFIAISGLFCAFALIKMATNELGKHR